MILDHKQVIIFGYPRSATKLLASVLQDFGYHKYGEWYDVWTSKVVGNTAVRLTPDEIIPTSPERHYERTFTEQASREADLDRQWKQVHRHLNPDKWVLTLWPNNLGLFPFPLMNFKDCYWLCTTRDRWTQLLSWIISSQNSNFDGLKKSQSVQVDKTFFFRSYWQLRRTEIWQQWILENLNSTEVPFEELTKGTFNGFGKEYPIKSKDEHKNLGYYIQNLKEVEHWYNFCENDNTKIIGTP